jgi:hypothetical protein
MCILNNRCTKLLALGYSRGTLKMRKGIIPMKKFIVEKEPGLRE